MRQSSNNKQGQMKTTNNWIRKSALAMMVAVASACLPSCSDDESTGERYFNIESETTNVTVPAAGISKSKRVSVVLRSNRHWTATLESQDDAQWLHLFTNEGDDDGIFRYWVDKNTGFERRTANIVFTVDGVQEATKFVITQEADVPTVAIADAENGYKMLATGGTLKVPVKSNVEWTASLGEVSWARIESCGKDTVYLSIDKNDDDTREVVLTCQGQGDYAQCVSTTVITQANAGIYLNERFDWMQEGIEDFYYNYPEQSISKWTEEELSHGWTSTGTSLYGGLGYIKLGKTNVAGDAISPKLSSIVGTDDVNVSFKCIGYVSKGGAKDDGVMRVMLIGDGEIVGQSLVEMTVDGTTYKAATFDVTVFPNSSKNENGEGYDPWAQAEAEFSFDVKGATANTQLLFVGGVAWGSNLKGQGQGKNRLLMDDVKVKHTSL